MDQVRGVWTSQDRKQDEHAKASKSAMAVMDLLSQNQNLKERWSGGSGGYVQSSGPWLFLLQQLLLWQRLLLWQWLLLWRRLLLWQRWWGRHWCHGRAGEVEGKGIAGRGGEGRRGCV
jgi:hypothetical protein